MFVHFVMLDNAWLVTIYANVFIQDPQAVLVTVLLQVVLSIANQLGRSGALSHGACFATRLVISIDLNTSLRRHCDLTKSLVAVGLRPIPFGLLTVR